MDERDGSAITNGRSIDAAPLKLVEECLVVIGTHRGPAAGRYEPFHIVKNQGWHDGACG